MSTRRAEGCRPLTILGSVLTRAINPVSLIAWNENFEMFTVNGETIDERGERVDRRLTRRRPVVDQRFNETKTTVVVGEVSPSMVVPWKKFLCS